MDDILKRLQSYNPPDRTIAVDIQDAAVEIKRLNLLLKVKKTVKERIGGDD